MGVSILYNVTLTRCANNYVTKARSPATTFTNHQKRKDNTALVLTNSDDKFNNPFN